MKSEYPKIFEPITIKRTTIKNRIAMTPMGTNYGETSGEMSNRHMNYYSLRAKGGTGLIILENANIEYPAGSNGTSQIRIDHDSFMPRYYQLVENLHKNGATVAIQINHAALFFQINVTDVTDLSISCRIYKHPYICLPAIQFSLQFFKNIVSLHIPVEDPDRDLYLFLQIFQTVCPPCHYP